MFGVDIISALCKQLLISNPCPFNQQQLLPSMLFTVQQFVFYSRNPTHDYYSAYVFWSHANEPFNSFYYFTLLFWWEKNINYICPLIKESNVKNTFSKIIYQKILKIKASQVIQPKYQSISINAKQYNLPAFRSATTCILW